MKPTALLLLASTILATARADGPTPQQLDFFEARVRPVLAEHCLGCHGAKKQMAGVRLDARAGVLGEGDHGPIVVPGEPDKSGLIQAVRQTGPVKMPPKGKLPPAAVEALTAWVKMGAPWPKETAGKSADDAGRKHWAFQPVRRPDVPATKDRAWPLTDVDRFVLARLEAKGLTPSPPADRRTLIRRATFDLLGLPPTPEEVEAFVNDPRPDAYEQLIDRLLASPHYGERWARHWLDVARYADTKGYVFFEEHDFPWAYTYRDYVIRAFNDDLPYDRFILEQLAADRLPLGDDKRPLTALGFLTLGGRFMNNQHDILDDRIDVVTRGLLGLTVSCARCHDHKFDPVPTADYYSLYGVFASCAEPTVPPLFQPPPRTEEYAKFDKQLKELEKKLTDFVTAKHAELTTNARQRVAEYLLAAHALRDQPSTEEFMLIADGKDLNPTMIIRWQKFLERTRKTRDPVFAPWHAYDDKAWKAPAVQGPVNSLIAKALAGSPPKDRKELAERYAAALLAVEQKWQALRAAGNPPARLPDAAEEELRLVFYGPDVPANVAMLPYGDLSLLPDRASQAKLQEFRKALEKWRSSGPGAPPRAMVLEDLPTPYQPAVFVRGNPNNKGAAVPRQVPAVLAPGKRQPFQEGSGRLELAKAIASKDNPLTARVLVNRVWLHHFGAGLVTTPSDFGLRSDPPSHPELLDYLAWQFMHDGWSLKKLHKRLMLSRVYQQQSADRPECKNADPDNRLLWRMPRRRLDFEATRDALLCVAGKLDRTVGGPSVASPFAGNANRRTLYSRLDRLNVPGLFRSFDFPSPDATSPQRDQTTIAPQALFLMNHPFVMQAARNVLARPEIAGTKDVNGKVERVYRLLFGRPPSAEEIELAREYVQGERGAWERYVHALLQTNEFAWVD